MTYLPSGPFCLSSMTSCSIFRPVTSVMALIVMPSNSRPKEWPTELSRSGSAMADYLSWLSRWLVYSLTRLVPPENWARRKIDELGRLDRRDADLADDLAGVDALGRVGLAVALDVERLVRA